jgi:hypothetical protein
MSKRITRGRAIVGAVNTTSLTVRGPLDLGSPVENIPAPSGSEVDEDEEAREAIEGILDALIAVGIMQPPLEGDGDDENGDDENGDDDGEPE